MSEAYYLSSRYGGPGISERLLVCRSLKRYLASIARCNEATLFVPHYDSRNRDEGAEVNVWPRVFANRGRLVQQCTALLRHVRQLTRHDH